MINQTFKITYQHIGGIKLGYLNANYPINNINYQSSYSVYSVINENTFEINLNYQSFGDIIKDIENDNLTELGWWGADNNCLESFLDMVKNCE